MSRSVDKIDEKNLAYKCILSLMTHYNRITEPFMVSVDINDVRYKAHVTFDFSYSASDTYFLLRIVLTSDKKAPVELSLLKINGDYIANKKNDFRKSKTMRANVISEISEHIKNCLMRNDIFVPSYVNNKIDFKKYYGGADKFIDSCLIRDHLSLHPKLRQTIEYLKGFYKRNRLERTLDVIDFLSHGYSFDQTRGVFYRKLRGLYENAAIDFDIISKITTDDYSANLEYRQKYMFFISGGNVKVRTRNGNEKIINPRKQFLDNYSIIVNANPSILREIKDHIDNLKPLPRLYFLDDDNKPFFISKKKQKLIHGRRIKSDKQLDDFIYTMMSCDVSNIPYINDDGVIYDDAWRSVLKLMDCAYKLGVDKETWLGSLRGGFENNIIHMSYAMHSNRPLNIMGRYHDNEIFKRLLKTEIVNTPKTLIDRENLRFKIPFIVSEIINNHLKYIGFYESAIPTKLTDLKARYAEEITREYIPTYRNEEIAKYFGETKNILELFLDKVILPIIVFLSGGNDTSANMNKESVYEAAVEIFNPTLSDPIKTLKMTKYILNRFDKFKYAGDDYKSYNSRMELTDKQTFIRVMEAFAKKSMESNERREAKLYEPAQWLHISPTVLIDKNGLRIIPLLNENEIKDEVRTMGSLEYGYEALIRFSKRALWKVFSIRDKNMNRITTALMYLNIKEKEISMIDHRCYRGGKTHPMFPIAQESMATLVGNINHKKRKVNWDHFAIENAIAREANILSISDQAGYFPATENHIKKAMSPWRKFMIKEFRDAPIEDFKKIEVINQLVNENKNG